MEEMKNENMAEQPVVEEAVVEQRPSTKYGRTAYQQQLQEEQAAQEAPTQNAERPYQQYQQNASQQYQQPEWQNQTQYNEYTPYEEVKPPVKNTLTYILVVLIGINLIATFIMNMMSAEAYNLANSIDGLIDEIFVIANQPLFVVLSTISEFVGWAIIALFVVDIIQLHKGGKKIVGAILFAIFLQPAYFIWRAHLLGQKKTGAIIYAVGCYGVQIIQYVILFSGAMDMVFRTM